jgi:hypothetical protein
MAVDPTVTPASTAIPTADLSNAQWTRVGLAGTAVTDLSVWAQAPGRSRLLTRPASETPQ